MILIPCLILWVKLDNSPKTVIKNIFDKKKKNDLHSDVSPILEVSMENYPANSYWFNVNNRNTRKRCKMFKGVVFLLLTLNIFQIFVVVFYC